MSAAAARAHKPGARRQLLPPSVDRDASEFAAALALAVRLAKRVGWRLKVELLPEGEGGRHASA